MKLYGKNPVLERIKSNPRSIKKIYIELGHPEVRYLQMKARQYGIVFIQVPRSKIEKLARAVNTQGILVEIDDFAYLPYKELVELAIKKRYVLLFLDELNDPQNLGGIMRSLACLGNFALVLPTHHSVEVTDTVLRVACGGDNYLPVAKVSNLSQAIGLAKENGFWIAGAVTKDGQSIFETQFPFPLGFVIGSEQKGIRDVIKKQLDVQFTVPSAHERMSLNAAQAAAMVAFEIVRQRNTPSSHKKHENQKNQS
jgi:23S rRNA (guanosine2251-2'-O)-methyltransferase